MEHLMKSLQTFFSYLDKHNLKWHERVQKAVNPLNGLYNQSEQLRLVKMYEDEDTEELPNIKSRLISKIKLGLEEELSLLKDILKECEACNKELKRKLVAVEQSCEAVETLALLRGTATHPAPCLMLEWAQDAWRIYHALVQIPFAPSKLLDRVCSPDDVRALEFTSEKAVVACFKEKSRQINYFQISGALMCLNYEDEDSIVRFQKAFKEDAKMKCHIERISAYTKFFIEGS